MNADDYPCPPDSSQNRIRSILNGYQGTADRDAVGHEKASRRFRRFDITVTLPTKILPFIATSLLAPDVGSNECQAGGVLTFAAMICTCISGLMVILKGIYSFDARSHQHKQSFLELSEFSREIEYFLARSHTDDEYDSFSDISEHKLTTISKQAPDIPVDLIVHADTHVDSHRTKMQVLAITQQATSNGKTCKERKAFVDEIARMNIHELRSFFEHQSKLNNLTPTPSQVNVSISRPTHTAISQNRVMHRQAEINTTTKQDLLESILLDCDLTLDGLKDYRRTELTDDKH
jgi:hypothetical protein